MIDYFWFSLLVGVNALLLVVLTVNVSRLRIKHRVSLGDGDVKPLRNAIRTHANGTEQVPIFALIVLALTLSGVSNTLLAVLVMTFTFSRFCHAFGMFANVFLFRRIGMGLTYVLQVVGASSLCVQVLG